MSSEEMSDSESCDEVYGIDSHGPDWRRRRQQIENELDESHDIANFRVRVHPPGCLPQWQAGPLVIPLLKSRYPENGPPLPFARTLLGCLPAELRLKIYGYAFGCPDRPIAVRKRLLSRHDSMKMLPFECRQPSPHMHHLYHDCWDGRLVSSDTKLLSLPLTCRQLNQETISMLYSHRTFSFHNVESLHLFLANLRPEHRDGIRSLSISTQIHYTPSSANGLAFDASFANIGDTKLWKHVCLALCGMAGLRRLRLYIAKGRYTLWASLEYQVAMTLESLAAVQHVEDFQIVFAASEEVRERFVEAPFRLVENGSHADRQLCEGCLDCLREA